MNLMRDVRAEAGSATRPETTHHPELGGARIDPYERAFRLVAGGAMVVLGARRGGLRGLSLAWSGGVFAYRGYTGRRAVGRRLAVPRALDVREAVVIGAEPDAVHRYLRDLTHLPSFMEQVVAMRPRRERVYASTLRFGPLPYDGEIEITEDRPGHFEWRSLAEAELPHRVEVDVQPAPAPDGGSAYVQVRLQLLPPGGGAAVPFHGILERIVHEALRTGLERLKGVLETRA